MKRYLIKGGSPINGTIDISGSKNAALTLLSFALINSNNVVLHNIPRIKDIDMFLKIYDYLNVKYKWIDTHTLQIDSSHIEYKTLNVKEVGSFRASYYLIGALLWKFKKIEIAYPGGCSFQNRPIDIHLDMFSQFGVNIKQDDKLTFDIDKIKTNKVVLKNLSFGATVNAILFASSINEELEIDNCNLECEILSLIDLINKSGRRILINDKKIIFCKFDKYHDIEFTNIPSRMEIGTFALYAAALGRIKMNNVNREHLKALEYVLSKTNALFYYCNDSLIVEKRKKPESLFIETGVYPMFPTDLQPILTSYLLSIPRVHMIKETIYENRFSHVEELKKLGGMLIKEDGALLINGIFYLHGNKMIAKDLRSASSLVLGALIANGESEIENVEFLDRGYEDFYFKLRSLNANIGEIC